MLQHMKGWSALHCSASTVARRVQDNTRVLSWCSCGGFTYTWIAGFMVRMREIPSPSNALLMPPSLNRCSSPLASPGRLVCMRADSVSRGCITSGTTRGRRGLLAVHWTDQKRLLSLPCTLPSQEDGTWREAASLHQPGLLLCLRLGPPSSLPAACVPRLLNLQKHSRSERPGLPVLRTPCKPRRRQQRPGWPVFRASVLVHARGTWFGCSCSCRSRRIQQGLRDRSWWLGPGTG